MWGVGSMGSVGSIPGQGAKMPYASGPENQNINHRGKIVINSIKTLKMIYIKRKRKKEKGYSKASIGISGTC